MWVGDYKYWTDYCFISVGPVLQSLLECSTILNGYNEYAKQLVEWVEDKTFGWKLCYRASVDGWKIADFHRKCDDVGPTVTLVKCGKNVFGGYTDQSWKKTGSSNSVSLDNIKPRCIKTLVKKLLICTKLPDVTDSKTLTGQIFPRE